ELEVQVVLGFSNPHRESLEAAAAVSRHAVQLLDKVSDMPERMAWADGAISAAGSTCWELAFMGVPMLIIVTADNQRGSANALERREAAVNLGWHADAMGSQSEYSQLEDWLR